MYLYDCGMTQTDGCEFLQLSLTHAGAAPLCHYLWVTAGVSKKGCLLISPGSWLYVCGKWLDWISLVVFYKLLLDLGWG